MGQLDDAYANGAYIANGAAYPGLWAARAAAFRAGARGRPDQPYGPRARERFDLFLPVGPPLGTVVFVHGGYWLEGDKSLWSHLAAGPVARGWAVAVPSYDLCPTVRIADITRQVALAIAVIADRLPGPLRLCGHSAGGHLVARMACDDLTPDWRRRVQRIVPISALSDLAPLMQTGMNAVLRLDRAEARAESPVLLGWSGVPVTLWVGADERPAFLDQSRRLSARWQVPVVVEPGRHHFDVIEGLSDPRSPLTATLLG